VFTTAVNLFNSISFKRLSVIISYHIIGIDITFFKALFIASISSISILIAITPGNLGIGDAIGIFSAKYNWSRD